jgi:hypothetical protein
MSLHAEKSDALRTSAMDSNNSTNAQGTSMPAPPFNLTNQLRSPAGGGGGGSSGLPTSGGNWEAPTYELESSGTARGAKIELEFHPNNTVNATKIALIQTAKAINNGAVTYIGDPTRQQHGIQNEDAIETDASTHETDEGTHIDMEGGFDNPIYAVDTNNLVAGGSLTSAATDPGWGQHGWNYLDGTGTQQTQEAKLKDSPIQPNVATNSSNIFEVAAVAIEGEQTSTYYGSVRWGWRTDAAGNHTILPLEVVSQGVPSSSFMKAGELWNNGTTASGGATIDMPLVDVKVASTDITPYTPSDATVCYVPIPQGTRVEIVTPWRIPMLYGTVRIVDGPRTGDIVNIAYQDWDKITDERA